MTNPWSDYIHLATLRFDWASAGIDRLEELVNSFLATKPCEVVSRMHREGQNARINYVLRVHEQPPPTVSFATGDVIHNLRATLDNLVWGVGRIFKARDRREDFSSRSGGMEGRPTWAYIRSRSGDSFFKAWSASSLITRRG